MSFFSGKKIFLLGFLIVLLFAIPLTVYLTQQQQEVTTKAAPTTTLSFVPTSKMMNVGDTTSFDIMMNPGSNQVSFVKLTLIYNGIKFNVDPTSGLVENSVFTKLAGPIFNSTSSATASVSVSLSVGSDPAKVISTITKIATLTLKATSGTAGSTTPIAVDRSQTQVLSVGAGDQANEDVLAGQPSPATVTINDVSSGSTSANKAPVCNSLILDRSATGAAPYSLTFTASGKDDDGTITKASFTFGDGQARDVTSSGGIGTNSVNAQIAHTYNNAGTYNASVILTDNGNSTSAVATCKTTITVTAGSLGSGGAGTGSAQITPEMPTETITPTTTIAVAPTIAPPGPGDKIIGLGAAGIILSILGGLLLLGF
ncbi:MAG: PKD domain-containing protein [Candidatus Levybacteria bacterium]|nr:PKD domain-containing protein [Candidatus Levybacteria bacterium]